MSNCTNCFNGCTEIISDRCVKYTGIDIPALGIQNGDTLSAVEESLTTYLSSVITGVGVKIDLSSIDICALVRSYLPVCSTCSDISILDISKALIQAACDLQTQVNAIVAQLTILNADYTIGCLTGVTASSDTHAILQATINKVCSLGVDLTALTVELHTQYSRNGTELNNYIANYLATNTPSSSKYYTKMIPYTVVEYYGAITGNFDGTGRGLDSGLFEKIYLCNGYGGLTPDKRGRVGVGVTNGDMLGTTLPVETNPLSSPFNPLYALKGTGSTLNSTTLGLGQIPNHTHVATVAQTPHTHTVGPDSIGVLGLQVSGSVTRNFNNQASEDTPLQSTFITGASSANISVSNSNEGGGGAHSNVQAGIGCYYIMYRP